MGIGKFNGTTIVARFGIQSFVILLIVAPYIYILNHTIIPWSVDSVSKSSGMFHSILATLLTILVLVSYILASTTQPGDFQDTLSAAYYLVYPISNEEKKFCNKCNQLKPERANHCNICKKCVLRSVGHFNCTGNCIGLFNQKYFVQFLFYSFTSILYFFYLLILRSIELLSIENQQQIQHQSILDLSYVFSSGILVLMMVISEIIISSMLYSQVWFLIKNMTPTEYEDIKRRLLKKILPYQQNNQYTLIQQQQQMKHNVIYDPQLHQYDTRSITQNMASVFGKLSPSWLLPTPPTLLKYNQREKKGDIMFV